MPAMHIELLKKWPLSVRSSNATGTKMVLYNAVLYTVHIGVFFSNKFNGVENLIGSSQFGIYMTAT